MNYFNYFTEIEDEFVKRRGRHLLISPLDWSLIEVWKQRGIPLHIVLRGINASFDSYNPALRRGRKISTLFYCQQEVEAMFSEYSDSLTGASEKWNGENETSANGDQQPESPFGATVVADSLTEHCRALEQLAERHANDAMLQETFLRVATRLTQIVADLRQTKIVSPEQLETDLGMIEETILDGLTQSAGKQRLDELQQEGKKQLRAYQQNMEAEVYQQTLKNFIARRLREDYRIPRLSLFYL